ncbi:MAG TPA: hypothetical protein VHP11_09380 [Tepidisphaeraceae bacterium]|nr:hypothetical protein [Tepidisphaeraceae bacterium]
MSEHDDELDQVITRAMRARPVPGALANLAARAMAEAQADEQRLVARQNRLSLLRRWSQVANVAACILIGLLLAAVFYYRPQGPAPEVPEAVAMNAAWPDLGDAGDSDTRPMDIELICGLILLGAVLFIAVEQSTASPWPRSSRLA